jgi:hypothetical protein
MKAFAFIVCGFFGWPFGVLAGFDEYRKTHRCSTHIPILKDVRRLCYESASSGKE